MKSSLPLVLLMLAPSLMLADTGTRNAVDTFVDQFARLDSEWRIVSASPGAPSDLKRYEIALQNAAESFFAVANAEQESNPHLSEAAGATGNLIVDSAFIIFDGGEKGQEATVILKNHSRKIKALPDVYLGVINSLFPSKMTATGFLTQDEIRDLRSSIAKKFGDKIVGTGSINGDNAFAQAGSLTDGFLKALKK